MFKEGDILRFYNDERGESCVFILSSVYNDDWIEAHIKYSFAFKSFGVGKGSMKINIKYSTGCLRYANEWEKNFLLDVMENNGYTEPSIFCKANYLIDLPTCQYWIT